MRDTQNRGRFRGFEIFYRRPLPIITVFTVSFLLAGYAFIWFINKREISINLEQHTRVIESMWRAVTVAHQETMHAYLKHYVMRPEVLEILKRANSPEPKERDLARADLFSHLWDSYQSLRKNLYVRQLHFHLPNNHSFLRFHAPADYGDDLTAHRPTVVAVNKLKQPHFGFESGRVITGFRYVFPIIDKKGNHLGSVELSRPFEALRQNLVEVDVNSKYKLLLREADVKPKLLDEFKRLYTTVDIPGGWVIEDIRGEMPDATKPLDDESLKVFNMLGKDKGFLSLIESRSNGSVVVHTSPGGYHKVTTLKLIDISGKYAGAVISISPAKDITETMTTLKRHLFFYTLLVIAIGVFSYLYLREFALTKQKHYEIDLITSTMGNGLYVMDTKGVATFVNDTVTEILGFSKEEILGKKAHDLFHRHSGELAECPIFKVVSEASNYSADDTFMRKDGVLVDVHVISKPMFDGSRLKGAVVVFQDISERKKMEQELYRMATTDSLTGLYNRRFQIEMLKNSINIADRHGTPFSISMIDIDRFKSINDTYGHDIGDKVIIKVAQCLRDSSRVADVISRWGGEEFLILIPNTTLDGAEIMAEKIRGQVQAMVVDPVPALSVSIGVAQYSQKESLKELIARADNALYEAKASGRNCVKCG